jgi:ABC-2 type transport system ATP-binding protein
MNAIVCEALTRTFGRTVAVGNLTLTVPAGSIFALLGPNGAGKSTTLKLLLGLLRPTSGASRVLGRDSTQLRPEDFARLGYVTEEQILPEWMTVAQLLAYCRPLYPTWDDALATQLVRSFALPLDRPLKKLSRGMRMKAALLSNLAYRPELLVLDEPFSGLDPLARDDFVQGLLELPGDDRPRTILVCTHDIDDVERLADHVGFLAESHLLLNEPADALRARFRRIEITGENLPPPLPGRTPSGDGAPPPRSSAPLAPPDWLAVTHPTQRSLRFVHQAFDAAQTPAALAAQFPGARIETQPLTLREIFVVLARDLRRASPEAAA